MRALILAGLVWVFILALLLATVAVVLEISDVGAVECVCEGGG